MLLRRTSNERRSLSARRVTVLALVVLALVLVAAGVLLAATRAGWGSLYLDEPVAGVVLVLVGGVLATRVPSNPIGWLFLAGGSAGAVATLANVYAVAADASGASGPWLTAAVAAGAALWLPPFLVIPLLLLLFPSGRLRSRPWRLAAMAGAAGGAMTVVAMGVGSGLSVAQDAEPPAAFVVVMFGGMGLVVVSLISGLVHLALRARAARGEERQQVRWLFAGGLATLALAGLGFATISENHEAPLTLNEVLFAAALLPLPLATGVAVMRHRLYDLGRLVSRTVVYGVLTATLLGVYLALVTFLALVSPTSRTSPLAVAGSTLAAAALFRPLRTRMQAVVDRRFNRRRYDASRIAAAFRAAVRDQVDLETVASGLVAATHTTVQPSTADIWLRGDQVP